MIPRAFLWNNLRLRPIRSLLTILSVAGAVAAVIAVLQSTAATRSQMEQLKGTLASRVAMEIVSVDATPFRSEDVRGILQLPGIEVAIPVFRVFVKTISEQAEIRCLATGISAAHFQAIRDVTLSSGKLPTAAGEVCVEASVAEHLSVQPGDTLKFGARGIPWMSEKKVVGVFRLSAVDAAKETSSILMTPDDASRLGKAPGKLTVLQIVSAPGTEESVLRASVEALLPQELMITKAAAASELTRPIESMISVGLNVAGLLAVIAAIFIVVNSFQMSVAERQRQVALMRIVGATTEQVRWSLCQEALILGLIGTALGIVPGIIGSRSIMHGMQEVLGFQPMAPASIQPHAVIVGLLFGPLVTLVSVWYPARTMCETAPLSILKSAPVKRQMISMKMAVASGMILLALSGVMFVLTSLDIWPTLSSIVAIAAVEIAGICLLPELIPYCTSAYYRLVGLYFPVEAQLGHRQLLDHFGRTALTVAVLFIVSATSICVGTNTLLVTGNVESWMGRTVAVDFLLFASGPTADMSDADSLPVEIGSKIRGIPGITMIDEISFSLATINGRTASFAVQDFSGYQPLPIDLLDGDLKSLPEKLRAGEVLLGSVLANLLQVHPGDMVQIEVRDVSESIRVAGVIREYTAGGLMIQMDSHAAAEVFPLPAPQVFGLRTTSEAAPRVSTELRQLAKEYGLIYQSLEDLQNLVRTMATGITSRLFLILILALVIAAFAIVNSLTMNVIEQTRHLGMLRVVGMLRSQAFGMFLLQSVILGAMGLIPGILMGILMTWLTISSFRGITDHGVEFSVDPGLLAGYFLCGMVLSLLAAAIPAIRAGRLRPLEAIHEE